MNAEQSHRRIAIVGARQRNTTNDYSKVLVKFFDIWKQGDTIVSGGCPKGGDKFAEIIAKKYKIEIKIYPADWHKYGRRAGFIRNTDIAENSDVLIACVALNRKGGTEDTIMKFRKFQPNNPVHLVI